MGEILNRKVKLGLKIAYPPQKVSCRVDVYINTVKKNSLQ